MRIDRLQLRNFKCFEKLDLPLMPQFNLLIGKNGTGKTALLDALSVALGAWLLGLKRHSSDCRSRPIEPKEVRLLCIQDKSKHTVRYEHQWPVEVSAQGAVCGQPLSWTRTLEGRARKTTSGKATAIKTLSAQTGSQVMLGQQSVTLPLLSYYGTGRIWQQPRDLKKRRAKSSSQASKSRFRGYLYSHAPLADRNELFRWFQSESFVKLEEGTEPIELKAVREAMLACVPGGRSLYYSVKLADLILSMDGQQRQPFNNLSDGYRSVLAMVGDIAWKTVQLNPHLGVRAPAETEGVVLIDELDLHLHPEWQRRIIDDLRTTFPKLQFVCTTHSPFLIQAAQPGEVIVLDTQSQKKSSRKTTDRQIGSEDYVGASIEEIVETVQGVKQPQRSAASQRLAEATERYLVLLRREDTVPPLEMAAAEKELRMAQSLYTAEPGLNALLRLEAIAKEAKAKRL